jgi:tRNA A-37 threonylcarbamoyl transferase component Bud32
MNLLAWLKKTVGRNDAGAAAPEPGAEVSPEEACTPPASDRQAIDRLRDVGLADGPSVAEAHAALASFTGTPEEGRAVEALTHACLTRSLPASLSVAVARVLIDRGEHELASSLLESTESLDALMLATDLAEERGDLASAVSFVERVLVSDLDYPGARERRTRYRKLLGLEFERTPLRPGATILSATPAAPFEVLSEIGRGGAAIVYQARDRMLGRLVALKIYHHREAADARAQLLHEARVAVTLAGPGIVRVFDVNPEQGWLALEWAAGGSLRDALRAQALSALHPMAHWALPLARTLARVHDSGWVHLDVKPANVLLTRDGSPLLTDFGSARRIGEPSAPGSHGYLSPERLGGRASDPRDDIFGFGRILEDVLQALPLASDGDAFRQIAAECTGKDPDRPRNGSALLARLSALLA